MVEREDERGTHVVTGVVIGERSHAITGRLFFGIALVLFGCLWTLENLGWAPAGELLGWWPALLVIYGVLASTGAGMPRSPIVGALFTTVGILLVVAHAARLHVGFGVFWALCLVFAGGALVRRSLPVRASADAVPADTHGVLRLFAVMGGALRRLKGQPVSRGELFAVMGGIELDLREARPVGATIPIEVFTFAGGMEIVVPETWRVESEVMPIAGAVEDRTVQSQATPPVCTLMLRGAVLLGGVVVRNTPGEEREVRVRYRRHRRGRVEDVYVTPFGVTVRRGRQEPEDAPGERPPGPGAPPEGGPPPVEPR